MGSRTYRDAVFPHAVIALMMGSKQAGTVEMNILYGPADGEPKRRLTFKLGIRVDIEVSGCKIADVLQYEEDMDYYK